MADLEKLVEELSGLNLMEAAELASLLEEKWGVSAAAPMAMGMMPMAGGEVAAAAEEKTEFDVVLKEIGPKKINVIKEVRALTGLGLKEAKAVVDELGTVIEGAGKEAAEEAKGKLEEAGAVVELK
ncbi:MAG: 50S ribosomal protein L7/L12 [Chloroflexi bacterium]|nr:MAG: 50S ribosomal protein L7/L12 [Chloroflexota bacterium]